MNLPHIAREMRNQASELGSASRLLWGVLRVRIEHKSGHWRLAMLRTDQPPTMTQRRLLAAAFGRPDDTQWSARLERVAALGCNAFIVDTEWQEAAPQLNYIARLQIAIGQVLDRWQRTKQRPPYPPSHIAAMLIVKGLECDWETGEFHPRSSP